MILSQLGKGEVPSKPELLWWTIVVMETLNLTLYRRENVT